MATPDLYRYIYFGAPARVFFFWFLFGFFLLSFYHRPLLYHITIIGHRDRYHNLYHVFIRTAPTVIAPAVVATVGAGATMG